MSDNNNILNTVNNIENNLSDAQDQVQTLRDLVERSQRETLSGATAFTLNLPGGMSINVVSSSDSRLDQPAPAGTTVQPKTSAQAGA